MQNILILDNSDDILEMFTLIFHKEDFKLSTCNSVKSLFDELQSSIPDLLILDVMHTQLSKKIICDDLRKRNVIKDIPILITSTKTSDIKNYKDFCANDGLEKPFELKDLIGKVKSLLSVVQSD